MINKYKIKNKSIKSCYIEVIYKREIYNYYEKTSNFAL